MDEELLAKIIVIVFVVVLFITDWRDKSGVRKLTKLEYRKIVWGLLKNYREDEITSLEILLEEILAVPVPEKKGKVTFNKKDNSRRY